MSLFYRIVYPRGNRSELSVVQVYDYEEDEYDIASSKLFHDRETATEHMRVLAERHGLNCPEEKKLLD
jgi:hypothetical protein